MNRLFSDSTSERLMTSPEMSWNQAYVIVLLLALKKHFICTQQISSMCRVSSVSKYFVD